MNNSVLPPEMLIEVTLQAGAVYYFINPDDGFKSDDPHYYVVLNNPGDSDTVLVCATSKIGEVQMFVVSRDLPAQSIVRVRPSEYSEFAQETIFNCNSPFVYTRAYLESLIAEKKMIKASLPQIDDAIVQKLRAAVTISPMVPPVVQRLIADD